MTMDLAEKMRATVRSWDGVSEGPSRFGGSGAAFHVARREFLHLHSATRVDVRTTSAGAGELPAAARVVRRRRGRSDWVELRLETASDLRAVTAAAEIAWKAARGASGSSAPVTESPAMNRLTIAPDRLAELRAICLAFPDAREKVAWGDPTWRVKEKIFAMQKGNYPGGRPSVWMKAAPGEQSALVAERPSFCFVPPYVGPKGWIGFWLDGRRIDWRELEEHVRTSYRLVAGPRRAAGRIRPQRGGARPPETTRR